MNRQTIQTRQLIGRQMSYENKFVIHCFQTNKSTYKIADKKRQTDQTQSGRQNVQKLRQQLTARFRYAGNLLHSKISVRFKL
jgi:hypothetical protein